jgi:hypothetical protein
MESIPKDQNGNPIDFKGQPIRNVDAFLKAQKSKAAVKNLPKPKKNQRRFQPPSTYAYPFPYPYQPRVANEMRDINAWNQEATVQLGHAPNPSDVIQAYNSGNEVV